MAFLSGFYVMTLENILIRFVNISLGSSSYSFTMIVSVFVLSIAAGSFAVGRMKKLPRDLLMINQLLITLLLLLLYLTLDTWPYWAHLVRISFQSNEAGFTAYHACLLLTLTLVLIMPVSLMGATVPITFHEIKRDLANVGRHSGMLFSLNTLGNLAGSLIGGLGMFYFLNNAGVFATAFLLAALSTCLAARPLSARLFAAASALAALGAVLVVFTPFYDEENLAVGTFRMREPTPISFAGPGAFFEARRGIGTLVYCNDGPSASVAVLKSKADIAAGKDASMAVFVNGKSDSDTEVDIDTLKLSAHLPALLAPRRGRVMVIGLGTGVTAGELALYPDVETIDVAEISPSVVEVLPLFGEETRDVHEDPRLKIRVGDAFRILGRSRRRWDIIVSEPSNPWVTGVDLLFTREFYGLAAEHLTEGGILLQWAQIYSADPGMVGMIVNTVRQEFEHSRVFMASRADLLILASKKPIRPQDLERAAETLAGFGNVRRSLEEINLDSLDAILLREIWTPSYLARFSGAGVQTMDNPRLHYLAGKRFFIGTTVPDEFLLGPDTAPLAHEYLMAQRHPGWKRLIPTGEHVALLLEASKEKGMDRALPMLRAVKLKAYLADPAAFPLSSVEKAALRTDLIPMIIDAAVSMQAWTKAGREGTARAGTAKMNRRTGQR